MTRNKEDLDPTFPHYAKEDADKVLNEFFDICDKLNIPAFLLEGTSLGFYRDGTYPRTDRDVDVGVLVGFKELNLLIKKLKGKGFEKSRVRGKNKIWIDLHYRFTKEEWDFLQQFDTLIYNGRIYNIPFPIEDYLIMRYGLDWKKRRDQPQNLKLLIEYKFLKKEEI